MFSKRITQLKVVTKKASFSSLATRLRPCLIFTHLEIVPYLYFPAALEL